MPEDTPTDKVIELQRTGKANTEVIQSLQKQGYSFQQISEALNQAQAKTSVESQEYHEETPIPQKQLSPEKMQPSVIYSEDVALENMPEESQETDVLPPPSPSSISQESSYQQQKWPQQQFTYQSPALGSTTEDIEEITESVIEEKWQHMMEEFGDMLAWKEKTSNDIDAIKQELMRVENRFENLQNSVMGKVKEYGEGVSDVGIEIKALGKLLSNIISPLTSNVKELERIIKGLKS